MKHWRRWWIGLVLAACSMTGACVTTPADSPAGVKATTGLYAPGSLLGFAPQDAATGYDTINERGPAGDGCRGMFGPPGTEGELVVDFTSVTVGGGWKPANVGAVWIQWVDPADPQDVKKERFVRTVEKWADWRVASLETWMALRCEWPKVPDGPDVIATPTLTDHNKLHHVTWDTKDVNGVVVPDGSYKLYIEVTEFEEQGPIGSYEFTKGPAPFMTQFPAGENNKGMSLTYTPKP